LADHFGGLPELSSCLGTKLRSGGIMNDKNSWGLGNFIAIIILGAILIIGGSLLGSSISKKQSQKAVSGLESQFKPVVEKVISYDGQDGKTALQILDEKYDIKTEQSSIGVFVNSIDGTDNTNDSYWMFYVDGQLAPVGADQYKTKAGEKIEWRYEKLQ
jgi:hypothetical protein